MLLNLQSRPSSDGRVHISAVLMVSLILLLAPSGFELLSETVRVERSQARLFLYENRTERYRLVQRNTIKPVFGPASSGIATRTMGVLVTGYSSTPEQTDDTPFVTASGTRVREGIVATNLLPFGTKIKIPEVYGEKVFTVEDRMHLRHSANVDIWFPTYSQAKTFGVRWAQIEVLN